MFGSKFSMIRFQFGRCSTYSARYVGSVPIGPNDSNISLLCRRMWLRMYKYHRIDETIQKYCYLVTISYCLYKRKCLCYVGNVWVGPNTSKISST
jgi:hypothetical protein